MHKTRKQDEEQDEDAQDEEQDEENEDEQEDAKDEEEENEDEQKKEEKAFKIKLTDENINLPEIEQLSSLGKDIKEQVNMLTSDFSNNLLTVIKDLNGKIIKLQKVEIEYNKLKTKFNKLKELI